MRFVLEDAPGVIRKFHALRASMEPRDANARATKVVEVEMVLELNVTKGLKKLDHLFPEADTIAKMISGDDKRPGIDLTARGKLGGMTLAISYGTKKTPVVDCTLVHVKSKPQLKIDEKGECKLLIKPRCKFTAGELTEVWAMIDADGFISMKASQMDLSEFTKVAEGSKKGKDKKEDTKKEEKKTSLSVVRDPLDVEEEAAS